MAIKEAISAPTAGWSMAFRLSVAIPTLVFHTIAGPARLRGGPWQGMACRDQVQTVGGLDPASQLLAPAAYRSCYSVVCFCEMWLALKTTSHTKVYHILFIICGRQTCSCCVRVVVPLLYTG